MAKVLMVDDDMDLREAAELVLKREGYQVITAANRDEGMKAVREDNPDLVILDVMMEEPADGFMMATELRQQGFNKPILLLSSIGSVTGMKYGRSDASYEFLNKPVETDTLLAKVKELLH